MDLACLKGIQDSYMGLSVKHRIKAEDLPVQMILHSLVQALEHIAY